LHLRQSFHLNFIAYGEIRAFTTINISSRSHVVSQQVSARDTKALSALNVSKHILNAQVSIRAPCCKQWYDCAECHAEAQDHRLAKAAEMTFICKKCKKAFRKDMTAYEESDEYCPHCDNHYVRDFPMPTNATDGLDSNRSSRPRLQDQSSVSRERMLG
jgi:uncharacterized CHY-type Zn-finger protein